jgi:geranylgeranyl pyrophosphate synthase
MDNDAPSENIGKEIEKKLEQCGVFDQKSTTPVGDYLRSSDYLIGTITATLAHAAGVSKCATIGAVGELSFATGIVYDDLVDRHVERHGEHINHERWQQASSLVSGSVTATALLGAEVDAAVVRRYTENVEVIYDSICETYERGLDLPPGSVSCGDEQITVEPDSYLCLAVQKTSFFNWVVDSFFKNEWRRKQLQRYLTGLSIAYQLRNDIKDIVAAHEGATRRGNDILERKPNFLLLHALHTTDDTSIIEEWWDQGTDTEHTDIHRILSTIKSTESLDKAITYIDRSVSVSDTVVSSDQLVDPAVRRILKRALRLAGSDPRANVSKGL